MCGRSALSFNSIEIKKIISNELGLSTPDDLAWDDEKRFHPSYNISPTSNIVGVIEECKTDRQDFSSPIIDGKEVKTHPLTPVFCLKTMRFGLIPSFYKSPDKNKPLHNCRGETISSKPIFKRLLKSHRCLVPFEGFFEWNRKNNGKQIIPYYIHMNDKSKLMMMAGLWDVWINPITGENICSVSIVTCESNADFSWIHDRIPVIFSNTKDMKTWLSSDNIEKVLELVKPIDVDNLLTIYRVSDYVNSSSNQGSKCIEKFEGGLEKFFSVSPQKGKRKEEPTQTESQLTSPSKKIKKVSQSEDNVIDLTVNESILKGLSSGNE